MKLKCKVESNIDTSSCALCEKDVSEATMIACNSSTCPSCWWHLQCVGLKGVSKSTVKTLKWRCPCCLFLKVENRFELEESNSGISTNLVNQLKNEIISELKTCLPEMLQVNENKENTLKDNTVTNKDKHAVVVKPNNNLTSYTKSTWAEVASKMLSPKLEKIPVSKIVLTKNGNGYLLFPNSKS